MTSSPKWTIYKGKGGDVIIKDRQTGHTIHQQIEARQHFRSSQFDAQSSLYTTTFTSILLFNSFFDELNHIKVDVFHIQYICNWPIFKSAVLSVIHTREKTLYKGN